MMNYKSKMVEYDFKNPVVAVFKETYANIMTEELSREYGLDTAKIKRKIILEPYYVEWSYYQMFHNYAIVKRGLTIYEFDNINFGSDNSYLDLINLIINQLIILDKNYI